MAPVSGWRVHHHSGEELIGRPGATSWPLARCEPGGLPPTCPPHGPPTQAALRMGGLFLGKVGRVEAPLTLSASALHRAYDSRIRPDTPCGYRMRLLVSAPLSPEGGASSRHRQGLVRLAWHPTRPGVCCYHGHPPARPAVRQLAAASGGARFRAWARAYRTFLDPSGGGSQPWTESESGSM